MVANGLLHRQYRGVFSVGHQRLPRHGRLWAADLAGGPAAALAFHTAGDLLELGISSPTPHVLVFGGQIRPQPGLIIHRSRGISRDELQSTDGHRHTTTSRTLLDLASALPAHRIDDLLDAAVRRKLLDRVAMLASFDARPTAAGTRALRLAIDRLNENAGKSRSRLERKSEALCTRFGIPLPRINHMVEGFEVDMSWIDSRLVVEVDGGEFHCTPADLLADQLKDEALAAAGYPVHRIDGVDISRWPAKTARTIATLRARYPA
jgi:very-short-patch-repair endonuclease